MMIAALDDSHDQALRQCTLTNDAYNAYNINTAAIASQDARNLKPMTPPNE